MNATKLDEIERVMRRVYTDDHPDFVAALGYLNEMRAPWWKRLAARFRALTQEPT